MTEQEKGKKEHAAAMVFPVGEPNDAYAKYFVGQSYLAAVSKEQVGIYNVTFEPGCRNNWHVHHAANGGGQIIICVAGRGFYQEWGKAAVEMNPGDCINIPAGVKHWHGAAPESWFSHLAVEVPGENISNEWLEAVSDEDYNKLRKSEAEAGLDEEKVMNAAIMHISINDQWPYGTMKKYWLEGERLAIEYEKGKVFYYYLEDGYWEPEEGWVVLPE